MLAFSLLAIFLLFMSWLYRFLMAKEKRKKRDEYIIDHYVFHLEYVYDRGKMLLAQYTGNEIKAFPYLIDLATLFYVLGELSIVSAGFDRDVYFEKTSFFFEHDSVPHVSPERYKFYHEIAAGAQLRAEWFVGDIPKNIMNNPTLRCIIAFGDILYNYDCRDNYLGAPYMLNDFSRLDEFCRFYVDTFSPFAMRFPKAITTDMFGN